MCQASVKLPSITDDSTINIVVIIIIIIIIIDDHVAVIHSNVLRNLTNMEY